MEAKLAEFLGILTGDGYVTKLPRTFQFGIVVDAIKDKAYLENYVKPLVEELFEVKTKITFRNNALNLVFCSKKIGEYVISLGFPIGRKGNLPIVDFVLKNEKLWPHFLRGYFDTDGCIFWDKRKIYKKPYPRITFTTISENLARDLKNCLEKLGFPIRIAKKNRLTTLAKRGYSITYDIEFYGHKHLKMWNNLVGSSNPTKQLGLLEPR
ncbi:MAG: hypothetical protein J4451_00330 [DPANN group archaeon]|nr:hypothetical protein [DPANN group archaeon]